MKTIIIALVSLLTINTYSQNIELDYFPDQKEEITDQQYNKGKKALERVYNNLKKDYKLTQSIYWNLAAGFNYMGEQPEDIYKLLMLAKKENPNDFCIIVDVNLNGRDAKTSSFYKSIGDKFLDLIASCRDVEIMPPSLEDMMAEKKNLDLSGLNESLINRLIILMEKDMRYRNRSEEFRKKNREAWIKLDAEARVELVKIFEEYGYAGKDVVGEHYKNYMCLLLEHLGKLEAQEKYLPLIANAFKKNQLTATPLQMLIDRIYNTKTGKQIFGSHPGPYSDDSIIAEVKKKYGL